MSNILIAIGWMGIKSCYLNVSLDEAKRRYKEGNPEYDLDSDEIDIREFIFEDEFLAYDVWSNDSKSEMDSIARRRDIR